MSINPIKNQTGAQSTLKFIYFILFYLFIYLFFLGRGGGENNGVKLRRSMSSNLPSPHQTGHEPGNRGLSKG